MANILNLPTLRPSLLLDFVNSLQVDPRVTFTRASTATRWNAAGVQETLPAGVPRIDRDPATGKCLGLLVEEGRTNLLTYSEDFGNASWLKRAGAAVQVGIDIAPDGKSTANRLYDTGVQTGALYISQPSAVFADSTDYTSSVFFKNPSAKVENVLITVFAKSSNSDFVEVVYSPVTGVVSTNARGAAVLKGGGVMDVGNGWRCIWVSCNSLTGTNTTGSRFQIAFSGSSTGAGDINALFWGAQIASGTFPTSYIATKSAAVTRAADIPTVSNLGLSTGTVLAKYQKMGWKHNTTLPVGALDLSKRIDNYSTPINDHIERLIVYPRALTPEQIARLEAV